MTVRNKSAGNSLVFTVDTHLFRELGSLLVARDSTALAELIKNAYDADATTVRVYAEGLRSGNGSIRIEDDGVGITEDEFLRGFLRIASRFKEEGTRRSRVYGRRFTGAKGIGRLAAHKLAALLELESASNSRTRRSDAIRASIDWDIIESKRTLDQATGAISIEVGAEPVSPGTVIKLSRLRRRWSESDIRRFTSEASSLQPPRFLCDALPPELVRSPVLFKKPLMQDEDRAKDAGFIVELLGDFASGDDYWPVLAAEIEWVVEVRSRRFGVELSIAPSVEYKKAFPLAQEVKISRPHPLPRIGPFFDARILMRNLQKGRRTLSDDEFRKAGVRVFMEGFRVLPYGEQKNDWLDIGKEYSQRTMQMLFETLSADDPARTDDIGLTRISPRALYGAVFLTEEKSGGLNMLVNREGFDETEAFEALRKIVRWSIHSLMRARAHATAEERSREKPLRPSSASSGVAATPDDSGFISASSAKATVGEALSLIHETRDRAASLRDTVDLSTQFQTLEDKIGAVLNPFVRRLQSDLETLRVLAAVGLQLSVFVHEINGLLNLVSQIESEISGIAAPTLPSERRAWSRLRKNIDDLRRNLDRQASYLTDMAAPDVRRRRTPQRVLNAVERAAELLNARLDDAGIKLSVVVPAELRTPKMFPSELRTILTNLLTNAIKASVTKARDRRIRVRAFARGGELIVRVENTGAAVDVLRSELLFRPFVSTSVDPDPILGQGMGLGLPITRAIVEQVGGTINFVRPANGFSTAVEMRLREGR